MTIGLTSAEAPEASEAPEAPEAAGGLAGALAGALCRSLDAELFFPDGYGSRQRWQVARARAVCGRCDAQVECLELALAWGSPEGIWAGTTPLERAGIRRRLKARPRPGSTPVL